ncbi:MAG: hypothetical protein AAF725_06910, partial [Acidobacteriota bacterium]
RHFEGSAAKTAVASLRRFAEQAVLPCSQWVLKDPRMCRLLPLWRPLLEAERVDLHVLLIIRSPLAVAASLQKRDGFSTEKSLLLWLRHYLEVEAATREYDRSSLHFEGLATSSSSYAMQPIWAATGIPRLPVKRLEGALESAIDRSLVHWEFGQEETIEKLQDFPWVATAYQALDLLGTDRDREARAKLDQIRSELRAADRLLFHDPTVVEAERHGERYFRLLQEIERYHRSIEAQRAEIDEMRKGLALVREGDRETYAELMRREHAAQERQEKTALALRELKGDLAASFAGTRAGELESEAAGRTEATWSSGLERLEGLSGEVETLRRDLGSWRQSLEGLFGEGLDQHLLGPAQALDQANKGIARLESFVTGRLDQRHLELLGKSLEMTSRVEAGWIASKAELTEAHQRCESLVQERARLEIRAIEAESAREASRAHLAAAQAERELAAHRVEEIRGQLEEAARHRAEALSQRDQVLHERAVRAENARRDADFAGAQLEEARAELGRIREQVEDLRVDVQRKDRELTQLLGRRSWKVTAPLRALYGWFRSAG